MEKKILRDSIYKETTIYSIPSKEIENQLRRVLHDSDTKR